MRKVFLTLLSLTFLWANPLPLVNYDPFYKSKKILHTKARHKRQRTSLVLNAIFNNRAYIGNKFYTVGEKIQGYKIKKVYKQSVVLQNHSSVKILYLQKKHLIQMKEIKKEKN